MGNNSSNYDLSIIIPTYNSDIFLERCINTCLKYSANSEVIIVDDGSTDNTKEVLQHYATLKNVKIIYQENQGQSVARNNGLKIASGEYILFVDSDDYICNNKINDLIQLAKGKETDILQYNVYLNLSNHGIRPDERIVFDVDTSGRDFLYKSIKKRNLRIAPFHYIIRKNHITQLSFLFDSELRRFEDLEFIPKLLLKTPRIVTSDIKFYVYTVDSDNCNKAERNNLISSLFYLKKVLNKYELSLQNKIINLKDFDLLKVLICTHLGYYINALKYLSVVDQDFWNSFILKHILKNGGWVRYRTYYILLFILKNKFISIKKTIRSTIPSG